MDFILVEDSKVDEQLLKRIIHKEGLTDYEHEANSYLTKPTGFSEIKVQFINFYKHWIRYDQSTLQFQD